MSLLFRLTRIFVALSFGVSIYASDAAGTAIAKEDPKTISLIMSDSGFNAEVVALLKGEVAKQGYELKWVVINDIIQPNKIVNEGDVDSNSFQHEPYFDQFARDHGLRNVIRGFYTIFTPSGLYSRKYKSLKDVPDGATFGIPVDPSNNGRALFMLQEKGLLKMRPGVSVTHASVRDIVDNPHHFKFREVDQLMLLRTLDDVDVGFLFMGNAILGGLRPRADALAIEDAIESPYKGVVVIHKSLVGSDKVEVLRKAYHSEAVHGYFQKRYGDAIIFLDQLNHTGKPAVPPVAEESPLALPERPSLFANLRHIGPEILKASWETLFMLVVTIPVAVLFGTPLGTLLFLTRPGSFVKAPRLYFLLNGLVNFVRSFPFLILLIAMIPVTRFLVGSAQGTLGAVVPMAISSIPYFARFVEQNLLEVNRGVIEAAESMGATRNQIIWKVLYTEARSGIANSITILTVSFLAYSTVAGLVGGGGIGDFAIRYGYYRYQTDIMFFTIALIIVAVQVLQFTGNTVVRRLDKRH